MKRLYLLPNLITAFSLSCGLFIIFRIVLMSSYAISYQIFQTSTILLLVAGLADVCDGAIARILKAESEFGIQFDSLADSITFGVAPPVIILKSFNIHQGSLLFFLLSATALIFSLCGVLRLARFNVRAIQKEVAQAIDSAKEKKNYTGMPIPAAGLAVVSLNLFLISNEFCSLDKISQKTRAIIMICALAVLGYFMVSRWKFPSLKTLNFRVKSFSLVFITAILAVVLLYGIFHLFASILFLVFWAYLVTAWSLSLARLVAGRKSKTLRDFEPDDDSDNDPSLH